MTNRGFLNTVTVIRVDTNAPLTTIGVGAGPNAIAITPDGAFAYVTNSFTKSPGTVSVIDLHSNAVTATVEVYRNPNRLAITPDGRSVYVGNFRSWNVAVIDTASNAVTTTVPLVGRPSGVAVNPNGAYVYVATLGGTVEVIETATNSISNVIAVGSDPYGIATTRNGGTGYVANFASGTLSVVDLATSEPHSCCRWRQAIRGRGQLRRQRVHRAAVHAAADAHANCHLDGDRDLHDYAYRPAGAHAHASAEPDPPGNWTCEWAARSNHNAHCIAAHGRPAGRCDAERPQLRSRHPDRRARQR